MSDYIDTRDGWREVNAFEYQPHAAPKMAVMEDDGETRYWVRETPLPPLPTIPYTVVRVTWIRPQHGGDSVATLHKDGWHFGDGQADQAYVVEHNITGFEILSEPRAVTAKAVLNRAREMGLIGETVDYYLPREFGVTDD